MTDTPTALPYNPATMDALARRYDLGPGDVLAVAAPVVAAELRRLSDTLPVRWDDIVGSANVAEICDDLERRADELDGSTTS